MSNILDVFVRWLGQTTGSLTGFILSVLLYLLIVYLLWGLPWSRIISKAGFRGKGYWILLGMMFVPIAVLYPVTDYFGSTSEISGALLGLSVICVYLGLLILAFVPWSVRKQLTQLQQSNRTKSNPDSK
jgi:hypothetical protein